MISSISRQQFASLLSGGTLTDKQTIKVQLSNTADFASALSAIAAGLHLGIVEHIEESASLYGCSISNHHICLLVKSLVSGYIAHVVNQPCLTVVAATAYDHLPSVIEWFVGSAQF